MESQVRTLPPTYLASVPLPTKEGAEDTAVEPGSLVSSENSKTEPDWAQRRETEVESEEKLTSVMVEKQSIQE